MAFNKPTRKPSKLRLVLVFIVLIVVVAGIGATVYFTVFAGNNNIADKVYYRLDYESYIQKAAEEHQVNPYWISAVIRCESNFNPKSKSKVGAIGLMQLMPETAQDVARWGLVKKSKYDPEKLTDPETNIQYGTAYLRYLIERYHEIEPAICAYNAGLANVDSWLKDGHNVRDVVEFPETKSYLLSVVKAKEAYQRLYPDTFTW